VEAVHLLLHDGWHAACGLQRAGHHVGPLLPSPRRASAGLIASGQTPGPEVYLLANDHQAAAHYPVDGRPAQQMGDWLGSLSYASVEGDNAWPGASHPAARNRLQQPVGRLDPIPNYSFIVRSYDVRQTEYDAIYLTLDRPYTRDAKWGLNFVYTYAEAWQDASLDEGTAFRVRLPSPRLPEVPWQRRRAPPLRSRAARSGCRTTSRHPPSSTLGSGVPFTYNDCLATGWISASRHPNGGRPEKQSFLGINEFAYARRPAPAVGCATGQHHEPRPDRRGIQRPRISKTTRASTAGKGDPGQPNPNFGQPGCQYNAAAGRWAPASASRGARRE